MVIRMERRERQGEAIVELHGWLSEEILAEFEGLCGSGAGLRLDLSHLAGADEAGLNALRRRVAAGARLEGISPYIRLLLDSNPDPNKQGSV
jgi:hypothetical protein